MEKRVFGGQAINSTCQMVFSRGIDENENSFPTFVCLCVSSPRSRTKGKPLYFHFHASQIRSLIPWSTRFGGYA